MVVAGDVVVAVFACSMGAGGIGVSVSGVIGGGSGMRIAGVGMVVFVGGCMIDGYAWVSVVNISTGAIMYTALQNIITIIIIMANYKSVMSITTKTRKNISA